MSTTIICQACGAEYKEYLGHVCKGAAAASPHAPAPQEMRYRLPHDAQERVKEVMPMAPSASPGLERIAQEIAHYING